MQCANKGIPLHIHEHFFNPFPNWKYAFTLGDSAERVFFTHLTLQNVGIPLEEKYRVEVQSLFQEFALPNYGLLRKGRSGIAQDSVVFTIRGALRKLDVVQQILSVSTGVADRIEAAHRPLVTRSLPQPISQVRCAIRHRPGDQKHRSSEISHSLAPPLQIGGAVLGCCATYALAYCSALITSNATNPHFLRPKRHVQAE